MIIASLMNTLRIRFCTCGGLPSAINICLCVHLCFIKIDGSMKHYHLLIQANRVWKLISFPTQNSIDIRLSVNRITDARTSKKAARAKRLQAEK